MKKGKTEATKAIEFARSMIKKYRERARILYTHRKFINELGKTPTGSTDTIDFDYLNHNQIVRVIKHFGGKWEKSLQGTQVNYTRKKANGEEIAIRCWCGEPPPNCKIITETIHVPDKVVPAHDEVVTTLKCT